MHVVCRCGRVETRRRTTTHVTLCTASAATPLGNPPRQAPGDELNRGPSGCALSSRGRPPRSAIRPSSDVLDGVRPWPATLGSERSAFSSLRDTPARETPFDDRDSPHPLDRKTRRDMRERPRAV